MQLRWDPHEWYKCKGCGWTQHLLTLGWCDRCNYSERCEWCGWWGYYGSWDLPEQYTLIVMDDLELTTLCMRCHALKEPPWWPNNRDRYHEWLLRIFRPPKLAARDNTYTLRLIAEYIAANKA